MRRGVGVDYVALKIFSSIPSSLSLFLSYFVCK